MDDIFKDLDPDWANFDWFSSSNEVPLDWNINQVQEQPQNSVSNPQRVAPVACMVNSGSSPHREKQLNYQDEELYAINHY